MIILHVQQANCAEHELYQIAFNLYLKGKQHVSYHYPNLIDAKAIKHYLLSDSKTSQRRLCTLISNELKGGYCNVEFTKFVTAIYKIVYIRLSLRRLYISTLYF